MNEDAFEFEENAAAIVAVAMRQGLRAAEVERARRKRHVDQTAHDLTMRALPYALSLDVEGNRRSLDLLDQAMERDPDHTLAIALAAWCQAQGVVYQFHNPGQARAQALSFAQRAISIGGDPTALPILGNAFALVGDVQAADSVTRIALAFDGSSPWAWMRSGLIDVCKQRSEAAVERLLIALDLARDDPLAFNSLIGVGCAHFDVGHHAEASHWYEQAIAEHPSGVWMHYLLCPAYMLCGRKPEARQSLGRLQRAYPELTISRVRSLSVIALPMALRLLECVLRAQIPTSELEIRRRNYGGCPFAAVRLDLNEFPRPRLMPSPRPQVARPHHMQVNAASQRGMVRTAGRAS